MSSTPTWQCHCGAFITDRTECSECGLGRIGMPRFVYEQKVASYYLEKEQKEKQRKIEIQKENELHSVFMRELLEEQKKVNHLPDECEERELLVLDFLKRQSTAKYFSSKKMEKDSLVYEIELYLYPAMADKKRIKRENEIQERRKKEEQERIRLSKINSRKEVISAILLITPFVLLLSGMHHILIGYIALLFVWMCIKAMIDT